MADALPIDLSAASAGHRLLCSTQKAFLNPS